MKTSKLAGGSLDVPACDPHAAPVTARPTTTHDQNKTLCQFSPMIYKIAKKIHEWPNAQRWGDLADFFQEGVLAFYHAMDHWDPNGGASFATYSYACVFRHLQKIVSMGSTIIKTSGKNYSTTLEDQLDEQFSQAITLAYRQAKGVQRLGARDLVDDRWDDQEYRESLEEVALLMSRLRDRDKDIIIRRAGLLDDEQSLQQIGDSYGISKERTRQLEASAKQKLENWLRERDPDVYETQVARSKMFTSVLKPEPINSVAYSVAPPPHEGDT